MASLWEFEEKHPKQFALWVSKSVPQRLKPSSAQACTDVPFVGQSLPQPLRVSEGFRGRQNWPTEESNLDKSEMPGGRGVQSSTPSTVDCTLLSMQLLESST
jgi:hypothetical protein